MRPEKFFSAFDTIADAPAGISDLRDLVLHLAVRGMLVEQDVRDEPVEKLMRRVERDAQELRKTRKIRAVRGIDPVTSDDAPFDLPTGWGWARLSDLAWPQAGFAFKSAQFNDQGHGVPLVRIRDIAKGRTECHYDGEYREEFLVEEGDYLIGMDGNFNISRWQGGPALLNQRVTRLVFFGHETVRRFVSYALQERLHDLHGVKAYTTVQHLSGKQIAACAIPVPPLEEQHRIVARVDELTGLLDRLEAAKEARDATRAQLRDAALAALQDASNAKEVKTAWSRIADHMANLFTDPEDIPSLRGAVIELATRGRLTTQEREDKPAADVVASIQEHRAKLVQARRLPKHKATPPISSTDTPYSLPDGWDWVRLNEVALLITDGVHKTPTYVREGVPFLSIKDISAGRLDFSNTKFIPEAEHVEINKRCDPSRGDVLFCRIGTLGRAVVVDTDRPFSLFVSVGLIKLSGHVNPDYLALALNSPSAYLQYERIKAGGSHTNKLNLGAMRSAIVPLPPAAEQTRIVTKVQELLTLVDDLEEALLDARTTQVALSASVARSAQAQAAEESEERPETVV